MEVFTYDDYIKSIHTLRLNNVFQLAEEGESYNFGEVENKEQIFKIVSKLMEKVLKNEREISSIINNYIEFEEKIKAKDLERYEEKVITKKKIDRKNIVYKMKNKNIFFLFRETEKINNNILFEVLNYCVNIIYSWNAELKAKTEIEYPIVIPTLIYTGDEEVEIEDNFSKMQISDYIFENYEIDFKYNVIEKNKFSVENLIKENTLFSYVLALGKVNNNKEFKMMLAKILNSSKEKKRIKGGLYKILEVIFRKLTNYDLTEKEIYEIKNIIVKYFLDTNCTKEKVIKYLKLTKEEQKIYLDL